MISTFDLPRDLGEAVLRLAVAMVAGVVLGLNRDLKDKPAGVRTHGLVALGSALVVLVSAEFGYGESGNPDGNPVTRTIQGIIAGIGFLGAGVIIKVTNRAVVRGLTTAATIWLAACLGIAAGAGLLALTGIAMALTLVLLLLGGPFERRMRRFLPARADDAALARRRAEDRLRRREELEASDDAGDDVPAAGRTALDDGAPGSGTPTAVG